MSVELRTRNAIGEAPGAERRRRALPSSAYSSFIIHHSSFSSPGFTLIELMATITIIAIIAGMFLGAFASAQQAANRANTQALISKLNSQLMLRYETYRTRRLPINTTGLTSQQAAVHRLNAVRELMRMELPDRYSDLMTDNSTGMNLHSLPLFAPIVPASFTLNTMTNLWGPSGIVLPIPAVNRSYQRRANFNATKPTAEYEDAECLYLIITTGLADDTVGTEQINPADVGDVDGDGMPEFIDAWGQPIRFIRWAPGFVSDLQIADAVGHHDPFDPLKLESTAYALQPLIFSHGPDRTGDIQHPPTGTGSYALPSTTWALSYGAPFTQPPYYLPSAALKIYDPYNSTLIPAYSTVGGPNDDDGDGDNSGWADNIHNHLIGP